MAAKLVLLGIAILAVANADNQPYLFYAGSGDRYISGIYGGLLEGNDLRQEVLTCVGHHQPGFNVSSMSYDSFIGKLLILIVDEDGENYIRLVASNPCHGLRNHCAEDIIINGYLPIDGGIAEIGPVALHRGDIYLIVRQCVNNNFYMAIRELQNSPNCSSPTFDIGRCTKQIAMYVSQSGCTTLLDSHIPLDHLLVTESADEKLTFLFQKMTNGKILELNAMSEDGRVRILSQSVKQTRLNLNRMPQSGGLSFHEPDSLCWSDVHSIECGQWSPGQPLGQKTTVLTTQDMQTICGSGAFITGVAIENTDPLEVYFGCHGNSSVGGGAGKIKYENGKYDVKPLTDARGQISAGSLFTVDHCPPGVPTSSTPSVGQFSHMTSFSSAVALVLIVCLYEINR